MSATRPTILNQNIEAFLDKQRRVENDKAEAERQHIIARPHLQERTNRRLCTR